jgi:hypothetical protein
MGFFSDIGTIFKQIKQAFAAIPIVGLGAVEIVGGVGQEIVSAPVGIYLTWVQAVIFIQTVFVFAFTNLNCAMRMMNNASYCAFFYILDILGQMFYLIPRLIIFALNLVGLPASEWEKGIWDILEDIDKWCIDHIGIHIIHLPKSIRETCFNCRRLKPTAFVSKAKKTADAIKDPIVPLLTGGIGRMFQGMNRIASALDF